MYKHVEIKRNQMLNLIIQKKNNEYIIMFFKKIHKFWEIKYKYKYNKLK